MKTTAFCLAFKAEPEVSRETPEAPEVVRFRGIAYSGGVIPNYGWFGDTAIDLATLGAVDGEIPVLRNHDPDQIVGRARLTNDGKTLMIDQGSFSAATGVGRETSALLQEGHPWRLSVGISAQKSTQDKPREVELNGQKMKVSTVFENARVLELSFVPAGADPNAYAAQFSARLAPMKESPTMSDDTQLSETIAQLKAKIAELETANTALATSLNVQKDQARCAALSALYTELSLEPLARDKMKPYLDMSEESFCAFAEQMRSLKPKADPGLFSEQANNGANQETPLAAKFQAPPGYSVDPEAMVVHTKAINYRAKHPEASYETALAAIQ